METEKWNGVPEVLNIKNLSIRFGGTNYYAGGIHHGVTKDDDKGHKGRDGNLISHEDHDADDAMVIVSLESMGDESENENLEESSESAESRETAENKTADHKDLDDAEDSRSEQPSWSTLLCALVRSITAEALLKTAKQKGENHGDEK